ncbi:hypothetical protein EJ08DRAFT_681415 [Tothia fuscella]|uniref:Uncharacterized protein n=1 Tax=Tothia fuscella TaxID=1048955 RepID=A0A9P4TVW8_9PEZI|nr:hypothetical protein EJ08DRAFT_681415 [Tothia fuscella]
MVSSKSTRKTLHGKLKESMDNFLASHSSSNAVQSTGTATTAIKYEIDQKDDSEFVREGVFPFFELAFELRMEVYKYLLTSPYSLRKHSKDYMQPTGSSSIYFGYGAPASQGHINFHSVTRFKGLNLRHVNKQMAEEAGAIFFESNTFIIKSNEDFPHSPLAKKAIRCIELVKPGRFYEEKLPDPRAITPSASPKNKSSKDKPSVVLKTNLASLKSLRYISIKSDTTLLGVDHELNSWLATSLKVLDFEDGGIKFVSGTFYDTFRVYGSKKGIPDEVKGVFIEKLQVQCSDIAMSGKDRFPAKEFVIEGVRVSIEFTFEGITTARIL